jgi:hypothetical protein
VDHPGEPEEETVDAEFKADLQEIVVEMAQAVLEVVASGNGEIGVDGIDNGPEILVFAGIVADAEGVLREEAGGDGLPEGVASAVAGLEVVPDVVEAFADGGEGEGEAAEEYESEEGFPAPAEEGPDGEGEGGGEPDAAFVVEKDTGENGGEKEGEEKGAGAGGFGAEAEQEEEGDHVDLGIGHVAGVKKRGAGADFEGDADEVVEGENDDAGEEGLEEAEEAGSLVGAAACKRNGEEEGKEEQAVEFIEGIVQADGNESAGEKDQGKGGGEQDGGGGEEGGTGAEGENEGGEGGEVEGDLPDGVGDGQDEESQAEKREEGGLRGLKQGREAGKGAGSWVGRCGWHGRDSH